MNFVFDYLLHTSWSDKKSDLAQYVQLCKSLRAEKDFWRAARQNIVFKARVQWMSVDANKYPKKCVAECDTLCETDMEVKTYRRWCCPEYSDTALCKCADCPNVVYQAEYVAAHQRMLLAQEARDMFWKNKFNKGKEGK